MPTSATGRTTAADFRIARSGSSYFYMDRVLVGSPVPVKPAIQLSAAAFEHSIETGQGLPSDSFTVTNAGGAPLNYSLSADANWIEVAPASGTSTGESDPVTIVYHPGALVPGEYVAAISVTGVPAAGQQIDVRLHVTRPPTPGDFDLDEDVDQDDFGHLQGCLSGSGVSYLSGCASADLDHDGDVDGDDLQRFRTCFGGAASRQGAETPATLMCPGPAPRSPACAW